MKDNYFNKVEKVLRVVGYIRVSTDFQRDFGYSVDGQIEAIKDYCKREYKGFEYTLTFINDAGYSAKNKKRPGLTKILNNGVDFDVVIFYSIDRLSRNLLDAVSIVKNLHAMKKNAVSIVGAINMETAMGKHIFYMLAANAEYESNLASERTLFGLSQKAKIGQYPFGGKTPLGFSKTADHKLIVNEDINIILDLYKYLVKQKLSLEKTRQRLMNKYSNFKMHKKSMQKLLYNSIYRGYIYIKDVKYEIVEPIFSDEMWFEILNAHNKYRLMTKHSYKFQNKVYMNNQKLYCCTKIKKLADGKLKSYEYYYNGKTYINAKKIESQLDLLKYRFDSSRQKNYISNIKYLTEQLDLGKIDINEFNCRVSKIAADNTNDVHEIDRIDLDEHLNVKKYYK